MNQALDLQRHFHVALAVEPLAGAALVRLQLRKLRLPESQDIGLNVANSRNIANLEIETIWDRRWFEGALPG